MMYFRAIERRLAEKLCFSSLSVRVGESKFIRIIWSSYSRYLTVRVPVNFSVFYYSLCRDNGSVEWAMNVKYEALKWNIELNLSTFEWRRFSLHADGLVGGDEK